MSATALRTNQPRISRPFRTIIVECRERPVEYVIFGYLVAYPDGGLDFEPTGHYNPRYDWSIENLIEYCEANADRFGSPTEAAYHRQNGLGNLAYSNPRWELSDDQFYFGADPV